MIVVSYKSGVISIAPQSIQTKYKVEFSHTKPGLNSWTGTRAAITKRLEDRLQKYGAVKLMEQ